MYKKDIVNFLFIVSFPIYGLGTYVSAVNSPSAGYLMSIAPFLVIILFYFINIMYNGGFSTRVNKFYYFMLLFVLSSAGSLFIALNKGLPEATTILTFTKSLLIIIPFHAFLIVVFYNNAARENILQLLLVSLTFLLVINLVGYFALGLANETHSLEGRLNFPFLGGFYSGASLLAIINLLLLYYLKRHWTDPIRFAYLSAYFLFNLGLFFMINSRLTILVYVLVMSLYLLGIARMRGIYLLSLFTIPMLLGSALPIYKILQLPGLSSMMQRVDIEDVTTFNGRAFLWQDAMNWLLEDRQGWIWGNGYKGHYFLGLIDDVAKMWNEKDIFHMHLHSTSMEILVSQGVVFFIIFCFILYGVYKYFKQMSREGRPEGAFFPVIVFMLFILQVDTFLYLDGLGFVIFSFLVAIVAIPKLEKKRMAMRNTDEQNFIIPDFKPAAAALV